MKKLHDVLVLNKKGDPIQIITWKKAVSAIYQGHARAMDLDMMPYPFEGSKEDQRVGIIDWVTFSRQPSTQKTFAIAHSTNLDIAIPEIVYLVKYDRLPPKDVKYSRENIFHRDNFECQYCGHTKTAKDLTIDHVFPKSRGGKSTWDNIVAACRSCNTKKDNRTPAEAGLKLRHKPVKPKWINPMTNKRGHAELCKSWSKILDKVSTQVD